MSTEFARDVEISALQGLIELHETEEKRLRRLIIETEPGTVRQEMIHDLEQVLRQIRIKTEELARLQNLAPASDQPDESHGTPLDGDIPKISWE